MNDLNAQAHDVDVDRDRRALAWWSDATCYGAGGWTVRDAEIARAVLRRRIQSGTVAMADPGSRSLRREGHD